jgi:hypothetical protein
VISFGAIDPHKDLADLTQHARFASDVDGAGYRLSFKRRIWPQTESRRHVRRQVFGFKEY